MDEQSVQKVTARVVLSVGFLAAMLLLLILLDNFWIAARAFGWATTGFTTERIITSQVVLTALGATTVGAAVPAVWAIHGHYALKRAELRMHRDATEHVHPAAGQTAPPDHDHI